MRQYLCNYIFNILLNNCHRNREYSHNLCHIHDLSWERRTDIKIYQETIRLRFSLLTSLKIKFILFLFFLAVYLCGEMPQLSTVNNIVTFQAQPFPVSKSGQYTCVFTLVAPTGTRIRFWFDDFGKKIFNNENTFLLVNKLVLSSQFFHKSLVFYTNIHS